MSRAAATGNAAAALPGIDGPISGTDLRTIILERKVIRDGRYKPPLPAALEDLAIAISVLRGRVRVGLGADLSPATKLADERKRRASEALETLAGVLPALQAEVKEKAGTSPFPKVYMAQLEELTELAAAVSRAWELPALMPSQETAVRVNALMARFSDAWVIPSPSAEMEITHWHDFAQFLVDAFIKAVQASNRSLPRLGLSENGPVPRFLEAIIPHITGESPTSAAIIKYLKRERKRGEDKVI